MINECRYIAVTGNDIAPYITDLGKLRIAVFYDFPYLYEGNLNYEKRYLNIYAKNPRGFLFAVLHNDQMVGATTAIPLENETEDIKAPFLQKGIPVDSVFYFGESILLPQFRGLGLGHRFFEEREAFALKFLNCTTTAFCSVERTENHPLRPLDYRSNDDFWAKRGYSEQKDMVCQMSWRDRGENVETIKQLTFWTKKWR